MKISTSACTLAFACLIISVQTTTATSTTTTTTTTTTTATNSPSALLSFIQKTGSGGCPGRNEVGVFSALVLDACAQRCLLASDCISFEFRSSDGGCQLSSSCTVALATLSERDWDVYHIQTTTTTTSTSASTTTTTTAPAECDKSPCGTGACKGHVKLYRQGGSSACVPIRSEFLVTGMVVKLTANVSAIKEAFDTISYVWNDAMNSIVGTEQVVRKMGHKSGTFGLDTLAGTAEFWYYPVEIVESVGTIMQITHLDPFLHEGITTLSMASIKSVAMAAEGLEDAFQLTALFHGRIPANLPAVTPNLTTLDLGESVLTGTLPSNLGELVKMKILDLGSSGSRGLLSGPIPPELVHCTALETLRLDGNRLTGQIPPDVGRIAAMRVLDLSSNMLTGLIPANLEKCTAMTSLELQNNKLTGPMPTEFGNWKHIVNFDVNTNELTGTIPTELGKCAHIKTFRMYANRFTGTIPTECGSCTQVTHFEVGTNELTGTIPTEFGSCTQLVRFGVNNNELTGTFPTEFGNWKQIYRFLAYTNRLTGTIPTEFGNWKRIYNFGVYNNELTGTIPTEFGNWEQIKYFLLYSNKLTGTIPTVFGNWNQIYTFQIHDNHLTGTIPTEFGNWKGIRSCGIAMNHLTGTIPTEFGNWKGIKFFFVYTNELTGAIPTEFGNWTHILVFDLKDNKLAGTIPTEFGKWQQIFHFTVNNNELTGTIPTDMGHWTKVTDLWISGNSLTGQIPSEFGHFERLRDLKLSHNELSGSIPSELCQCRQLIKLVLEDNRLNGSIPSSVGCWSRLTQALLGTNKFIGTIPRELSNCTSLTLLDLHDNQLTGSVPPEIPSSVIELDLRNNKLMWPLAGVFARGVVAPEESEMMCGQIPLIPRLDWPALRILFLSGNPLGLPAWDFLNSVAYLPSLTHLHATNSKLFGDVYCAINVEHSGNSDCSEKAPKFAPFPSLLIMDLSDNMITSVSCLPNMETLTSVDLSNNTLNDLADSFWSGALLLDLRVDGNPQLFEPVLIVSDESSCPSSHARLVADPTSFQPWQSRPDVECTQLCRTGVTTFTTDPFLDTASLCRCQLGWGNLKEQNVSSMSNVGFNLCGSICSDIVPQKISVYACKTVTYKSICNMSEDEPPPGFTIFSTLDELCPEECTGENMVVRQKSIVQGSMIDCFQCPQSTFWKLHEDSRTSSCISCPLFSESRSFGSMACKDCICQQGYHLPESCLNNAFASGACELCPQFPIRTTRKPGAQTSLECICNAEYTGIVEVYGNCGCIDGFFLDRTSKACVRCYNAAEMCMWKGNISLSLDPPRTMPGFWSRPSNGRPDVWRCFNDKTCIGDSDCATGRDPQIKACGVCFESWYGKAGGPCEECEVTGFNAFLRHSYMFLFVFAGMPIAHALLSTRAEAGGSGKAAQIIRKGAGSLLKYIQVLAIVGNFEVNYPPDVEKLFQFFGDLISFCSIRLGGVACISGSNSALLELVFETLLPLMVLLAIAFVALVWKIVGRCLSALRHPILKRVGKFVSMDQLGVAKVGVAYLTTFFTSLLASGFSGLGCMASPNGKMSLVRFAHIQCPSDEFWPIAMLGLVHVMAWGISIMAIVVWISLRTIDVMGQSSFAEQGAWAFIFEDYRLLRTFWPVIPLCQFCLLNVVSVISFGYGTIQLLLTGAIFAIYAVVVLWEHPYKKNSDNLSELWTSSFTTMIVVFAAGLGFSSEPGKADIADSFAEGEEDSAYKTRSYALLILIVLSIAGPTTISVYQVLLLCPLTRKMFPKSLKPMSDKDRASFESTWQGREVIEIMAKLDDIEFSVLHDLLVHSRATIGMIPEQGNAHTPIKYIRNRISQAMVSRTSAGEAEHTEGGKEPTISGLLPAPDATMLGASVIEAEPPTATALKVSL